LLQAFYGVDAPGYNPLRPIQECDGRTELL